MLRTDQLSTLGVNIVQSSFIVPAKYFRICDEQYELGNFRLNIGKIQVYFGMGPGSNFGGKTGKK